jgi:hypothetical protein
MAVAERDDFGTVEILDKFSLGTVSIENNLP